MLCLLIVSGLVRIDDGSALLDLCVRSALVGRDSQVISDRIVALLSGPERVFHVPASPRTLFAASSAHESDDANHSKVEKFEAPPVPHSNYLIGNECSAEL